MRRLGIFLVALLVLGLVYQIVASWIDVNRFPAPGQLVDMGGYRLHINCQGPTGKGPTVVMDAGLGEGTLSWSLVTPELVSDTRVCTFDRAGMGWSDPGSRSPSVADRNAELHLLLQKAGVQPPYVLVGHSLGGAYAFAYMRRYPDETAGLVLVDSGNNSGTGRFDEWVQTQTLSDTERQAYQSMTALVKQMMPLVPLMQIPNHLKAGLAPFGVMRIYYLFSNVSPNYPATLQAQLGDVNRALHSRGSYYGANFAESAQSIAVYQDAYANMTGCGNKPIMVLSASQTVSAMSAEQTAQTNPESLAYINLLLRWQGEMHKKMAACSNQGQQQVIESSHYMIFDQPGAIGSAIRQVVKSTAK